MRGRVDRVDRLPGGGHELIDYKTGERKSEADLESDLQLALYRLAAREAWDLEAGTGSYYYVLDGDKVAAPVQARRRRAGRADGARGRRGRARPGLRAAPLAHGLRLVRLPADLPGGGELTVSRRAGVGSFWNSRAIVSAEGSSSALAELLGLLGLDPLDQLLISGLAATARPICSS